MAKSLLSAKISLCESIEHMTTNECVDLIDSMKEELGCGTLGQLLIKIVMKLGDTWSLNNLENLSNKVQTIKSSSKTQDNSDQDKKPRRRKRKRKSKVIFPLNRLPIDIINQTSLFLNENDLFYFERCCRLFYKMINNALYLKKCNNFKTFKVTAKRLFQMSESNYSFYKYSQARRLKFGSIQDIYQYIWQAHDHGNEHKRLTSQFINIWIDTLYCNNFRDKWWENIFKSIECLILGGGGGLLWREIPFHILFNATKSNLQTLEIESWYCDMNEDEDEENIHNFMEAWKKWKDCNLKKGIEIKQLKHLKWIDFGWANNYYESMMNTRHLEFKNVGLNWDDFPGIRCCRSDVAVLTMDNIYITNNDDFDEDVDSDDDDSDDEDEDEDCNVDINTFRWLYMREDYEHEQIIIKRLNLCESVKNLTLLFDDRSCHGRLNPPSNYLQDLLNKKYYYNLKNVNCLIHGKSMSVCIVIPLIDRIFDVLKKNATILENSFDQFNVGLRLDKVKQYLVFQAKSTMKVTEVKNIRKWNEKLKSWNWCQDATSSHNFSFEYANDDVSLTHKYKYQEWEHQSVEL